MAEDAPYAFSLRKTGAGCLANGLSRAAWKLDTSAGGVGVSTAWILMSFVNRSSRRSTIRGRGRFRNGSRIGFADRFSASSTVSNDCSIASSPDRKTRFVKDLKGINTPPRFDAGVALIAGLPVRAALWAGLELEGVLGLFAAAEGFSSEESSFFENIFENGFANTGFWIESFSGVASSLWLKPIEDKKQNDKQAIAKRFLRKMLFDWYIAISPSQLKSSSKISSGFIGRGWMLK